MNHPIKFRVWSKLSKSYVFDRLLDSDGKVYDFYMADAVEIEPEASQWPDSDGTSMYIVQFFTGFYDKNDQPIFDGDLVNYSSGYAGATSPSISAEICQGDNRWFVQSKIFHWALDRALCKEYLSIVGSKLENINNV